MCEAITKAMATMITMSMAVHRQLTSSLRLFLEPKVFIPLSADMRRKYSNMTLLCYSSKASILFLLWFHFLEVTFLVSCLCYDSRGCISPIMQLAPKEACCSPTALVRASTKTALSYLRQKPPSKTRRHTRSLRVQSGLSWRTSPATAWSPYRPALPSTGYSVEAALRQVFLISSTQAGMCSIESSD